MLWLFSEVIWRKDNTLLGESVNVAILDTFVAITAGLIIFPACFAFGVNPDSGPSLIFITLPNVFISMIGGRIWGSLFFLFMSCAAFSTVIAVFENIIACDMELFEIDRKKSARINVVLIILLSLPCALGYNVLSGFEPLGAGSSVLDLEDFLVSNILLPLGSLVYLLFATWNIGWGIYQISALRQMRVLVKGSGMDSRLCKIRITDHDHGSVHSGNLGEIFRLIEKTCLRFLHN